MSLLRGLATGSPAFDLQLIKATVDLVGQVDASKEDEAEFNDTSSSGGNWPSAAEEEGVFAERFERDVKSLSFWKNVSMILGTQNEKFPLSLFYAALDISSEDRSGEVGILPSHQLQRNKRINRR